MADFILLETGDKLLLETGDGLLNESSVAPITYNMAGTVSGGPGSLSGTLAHRIRGVQWVVLARIFLDSGFEYEAIRQVNHPTRTYEGRVLKYGLVDKSISTPAGLPQTADAKIRLADTDRRWRTLLKTQTPIGRTIELKFVQVGLSESSFYPHFVGTISDFNFGPGYVELSARDSSFDWLDQDIPPLIPTLYPGVDGFFNIVIGNNESIAPDFGGVVPLTHIGFTTVDRWALARHQVYDVGIYRKTNSDDAFVAVDPAEYDVTVETTTIDGVDYDLTYIDFLVQQPDGTLIRADVEGVFFRPIWNGYPAQGFDAVLNPSGTPGALRNPIDGFTILDILVFTPAGVGSYDANRIMAIREKFLTVITNPSTGGDPYYMDGSIVKATTNRAALGQYLTSFQLDMFHTRTGAVALNFTDATDSAKPLYSDNRSDGLRQLIVENTFLEGQPSPAANRSSYFFERNYAEEAWLSSEIYDNTVDQDAMAVPIYDDDGNPTTDPSGTYLRTPKITIDTFEMFFVRDSLTANDVVARRMSFLALGSYRQTFQVPIWMVMDEMEMARQIEITCADGLDTGGYSRKEVKIVGMTSDNDGFALGVRTVLRVPQTIQVTTRATHGSATASAIGELASKDLAQTFSDDFARADTTPNDLGSMWTDICTALFNLGVRINIASQMLQSSANNGVGGGMVAKFSTYATRGLPHTLLGTAHQLSEGTLVFNNSVSGAVQRDGPSVCMSGNWNGLSASCYYIESLIELGTARICRLNLTTRTVLSASPFAAAVGQRFTLTAEIQPTYTRLRAYLNGVQVDTVDDSSGSRLTDTGDVMGYTSLFCSVGIFTHWDDWKCATP